MNHPIFRVKILEENNYKSLEDEINRWFLDEAQKIEKIVNVSIAREYAGYGKYYSALILYQLR